MPAKKNKKKDNSDIKATGIILLIAAVLGVVFFLFHRQQRPAEKKEIKHAVAPVLPQPPVKPVPIKLPPRPLTKKTVAPITIGGKGAKIAFVIDDWGYSMKNCAILKEIPEPLAVSILPSLRHSEHIASCAQSAGKTIMLHLPMEPYKNADPYPANYLITTKMSPDKVEKIIESIFAKMPLIEGVNNHMGSKAMESRRLVELLFRHLKKRRLFFVDSMTSPNHSYGLEVSTEYGLPFGERDVFLDNINTREAILGQFKELKAKASKKGYAVAIGHDRALTMQMIKEEAPILEKQGFTIVGVKDLLRNK